MTPAAEEICFSNEMISPTFPNVMLGCRKETKIRPNI